MGDVSKNINIGGEIGLDELYKLSLEGKAVVIKGKHLGFTQVRPASFIINWSIVQIKRFTIHYAIHDKDIPLVEFEET